MDFNVLRKELEKHAELNHLGFRIGKIWITLYSPSPCIPLEALIAISDPLIAKVILVSDDTLEFHFQKPNLPDEIDYTGFCFKNTDKLDELLSGSILRKYPNARLLHEALLKAFHEKEELYV